MKNKVKDVAHDVKNDVKDAAHDVKNDAKDAAAMRETKSGTVANGAGFGQELRSRP